tara:strand:- start:953 stop:1930 length:978 start_codon:yes stop_codon:yes gene_type:complete
MDKSPKVSVVMSVYNGQNWLKYSIESILNQTFRDFEFIIVDDGSTDSSIDIINFFQSRDKRIRIIQKKNTGLADSLNIAINSAKSEWIARIDCDDKSHLKRLEKQYLLALNVGKNFIIGSNCNLINSSERIISEYKYPEKHNRLKRNLLNLYGFFPHSSAFFSFSSFQKLGGYRIHYERSQDYDLWLRSLSFGLKFLCVQEPLVFIRKHENQISSANRGLNSVIYSTCALTCFYLREKNIKDPADIYDIREYGYYLKNIVTSNLKKNFIVNEENFFSVFIHNLNSNPIYMPIKFIYKFFKIVFSKINDYRRVRIAINIAKYYNDI